MPEHEQPDDYQQHTTPQGVDPSDINTDPHTAQTNNNKQGGDKRESLTRYQKWELLLAFGGLAVAAFGVYILLRQNDLMSQQNEISGKQVRAMAEQTKIMGKQIELERPWVSADLSVRRQMALEGTIVSVVVGVILKNVGHSAAINIHEDSRLLAGETGSLLSSDKLKTCEVQGAHKGFPIPITLFPGEAQELIPDTTLWTDIRSFGNTRSDIWFTVVTCIDYQSSLSSEHHQTAYLSEIGEHNSLGGTNLSGVENTAPGEFRLFPDRPATLIRMRTTAN